MIIISDTSPLNYLILIDQVERLKDLYGRVIIPRAVHSELQAAKTSQKVREWVNDLPAWIEIHSLTGEPDTELDYLGPGEREAIALGERLKADALLMDDRDGRQEASKRQLKVIGTLAVLVNSYELGLLDLSEAFRRLQQTTFRASPRLFQALLDQHKDVPHK